MAKTWTVLIVDDDPAMRRLGRAMLERLGLIVTDAGDGRTAVELFTRSQADLVLLDIKMPGEDGFSTCERIRRLPFGRDVPILMVTSMAGSDIAKRAAAAGATDYVTKPINWSALAARVQAILADAAPADFAALP